MIHQLNIYGEDKVDVAIKRLKTVEPDEGYYVAFSGGKDSVVIKALCDMACVKYDAHYNNTGIDPPEVLRFMKKYYPDVIWETPRNKDGKRITMWNLITEKLMPPTRVIRYCCSEFKENGGIGRFVVTGVRWAESARRKNSRKLLEESSGKAKRMSTDNLEDAPLFKFCHEKSTRILNPIIDWTTEDVWEFIHEYKVPYCELYDQGVSRIGCIGCPMGGGTKQIEDFERYPKYRDLYIKAFEQMLIKRAERGLKNADWKNAEEVMDWWTSGKHSMNQTTLLDIYEEEE